jgi:hypothetical protein
MYWTFRTSKIMKTSSMYSTAVQPLEPLWDTKTALSFGRCLQEGVAANHVFVFSYKPGAQNFTHSAEVKSVLEKTTRNSSKLYVYLQKPRGAQRSATERVIRCAPGMGGMSLLGGEKESVSVNESLSVCLGKVVQAVRLQGISIAAR